jgi:uncharacterized lipoprotein NlpE involved in copper resistance
MRRLILPLAALALVSACKKEAAPVAEGSEAAAAAASTAAAPAAMPALATNARAGGAYAGSYSQTGADGKTTTLTLAADGTYAWTGADGKAVKGKFSWYKDGSTILLDAAGGKGVFAIADGGVYKLASNDAPRTGFTADQLWTKAAM